MRRCVFTVRISVIFIVPGLELLETQDARVDCGEGRLVALCLPCVCVGGVARDGAASLRRTRGIRRNCAGARDRRQAQQLTHPIEDSKEARQSKQRLAHALGGGAGLNGQLGGCIDQVGDGLR
ncbi:MAG: hypothetical protein ACK559_13090, partial [bacterium]